MRVPSRSRTHARLYTKIDTPSERDCPIPPASPCGGSWEATAALVMRESAGLNRLNRTAASNCLDSSAELMVVDDSHAIKDECRCLVLAMSHLNAEVLCADFGCEAAAVAKKSAVVGRLLAPVLRGQNVVRLHGA